MLLALLVTALLAPPAARASCGDYVLIGDRPAGASADAVRQVPSAPMERHAPCTGPLCSRHPVHLPLLPLVPIPERVDQWGWVGALLAIPDEQVLGPVPTDVGDRPVRQGRAVYHPPR